nr:retrovirus-related Pol polyprotein from transposon TNT 1-94 [Tanacetum cinerariifolium]
PNGDALRKCILNGPYKPTTVVVQAVATTDDSLAIPKHTTVETPMNMSPANKAYFESEKEAIDLILTGIGYEIYSTVDACQTAQEMWEAIERLQQGESLNIQYPEWLSFVTIVKQQHKLDDVSYHKLFDILKQFPKEVNGLRDERLARNANPLALVATAQANQDPYYQTSKSQKSYAPSSKPSTLTRSHTTTRYKGKEIAKPITPPSESASEEFGSHCKVLQKDLQTYQQKPQNFLLLKKQECGYDSMVQERQLIWTVWESEDDEYTYGEIDEQELEAHYSYMAKIQEVPTADTNTYIVETDDSHVIPNSPDMCEDDVQNDQNDVERDDERVALANLIANLKLDVDENKKIQKQLKKANIILAQELKECKTILAKISKTLRSLIVLILDGEETLALEIESRSKLNKDSQEMHADLKYVESLENEIDKLESDKAEFLNMYDKILQESSEEDNDPEQAQRDKDMQKNLALIEKYFKKIYKHTNNNLRTSSNSRNKNVDTTLRYKNDNQSRQFRNQRTMNVAGARENVGSPVVQQSGIQCFYCKEFGHFAKECKKPKRVKDFAYHKVKMLLCKQAEKGFLLQAEQYDWLADTNEEIDEQELEAHYIYMARFRSNTCLVETNDSNVIPDSPDMCDDDIQNEQNDVESDDEHVALANLISNLKLDTDFEKYKAFNDRTIDYEKLQRKLNETLGQLAQKDIERKEGLKLKSYEISVIKEKHDELIKQSLLTKSHYEGLGKQKIKVITDLKLKEEQDIDKMLSMEKQLKFLNNIVYKKSQSIQTIHMMAPKVPTYNGRPSFANPRYIKQAQSKIPCLYAFPYDQSTHANRLIPDREETLALEKESRLKLNKDSKNIQFLLKMLNKNVKNRFETQLQDKNIAISELKKLIEKCKGKSVETKIDKPSVVRQPNSQRIPKPSVLGKPAPFSDSIERRYFSKTKLIPKTNVLEGLSKPVTTLTFPQTARQVVSNTNVLKPVMYRIDNKTTQIRAPQSPQTFKNTNPHMSTSTGVNHKTNVSRPQHRSNQMKDKVMPNNSQVKLKKTQVEDHPRIPSIFNNNKFVTAYNDSLNSKTLNANAVCATCGKCLVDSNHFPCVTKMLNDVHVRTKKPNVVPISTRKPKGHANKSITTPHNKKVTSTSTIQKPKSYYRMLYEKTSKAQKWWIEQQCPSGYKWFPKTKMQWAPKARNENVQKRIVQLILFIVDSECTKHMNGNLKLLCNFVEKFLGTVRFSNDQFSPNLGYGDLVQRSLGAKASLTQAWLWHQRLSHLNFDYINLLSKRDVVIGLPKLKYVKDQLCSSCELNKAKRSSFKSKAIPSSKGRQSFLHMDLCGPMRVASINGKKYILVIVDDYLRYT